MAGSVHKHWEFDSICPHCQKLNHVKTPVGTYVVRIYCEHCTHGYEYTHIVKEYHEVEDEVTRGSSATASSTTVP